MKNLSITILSWGKESCSADKNKLDPNKEMEIQQQAALNKHKEKL